MDPAAALANRILGGEAWATARLAAHAGRVFAVAAGPLSAVLRIDVAGRFEALPQAGSVPDLTLRLSPLSIPAFLANPSRWSEFVAADGDRALEATLAELALTLPWFAEKLLADLLGPIVGQRAADAGRSLLAFPEYAAARVADSLGSYARDEGGLFARAGAMQEFTRESSQVAAQAEALAQRIDALAARIGSGADAGSGTPNPR